MLFDFLSYPSHSKHFWELGRALEGLGAARVDVPSPWMGVPCSFCRSVSWALSPPFAHKTRTCAHLASQLSANWQSSERAETTPGQLPAQRGLCSNEGEAYPRNRHMQQAPLWINDKTSPSLAGYITKRPVRRGAGRSPHPPALCVVQPPWLK